MLPSIRPINVSPRFHETVGKQIKQQSNKAKPTQKQGSPEYYSHDKVFNLHSRMHVV
jgi:hypothetical protein